MSHDHDSDDLKLLGELEQLAPTELKGFDVHTRKARRAGASRGEVAEAVFISAALRAGAAATHGTLALKRFDSAK